LWNIEPHCRIMWTLQPSTGVIFNSRQMAECCVLRAVALRRGAYTYYREGERQSTNTDVI